MKAKISITINDRLLQDIDSIIDNVYIRNRSQAIELLASNALGDNKIAVILSGGDEKNLEITGEVYRPTAKILGESIVEKAIKKLRKEGFKIIYIIARKKVLSKIFEVIGEGSSLGVKVNYVEEKSSKGTADSLKMLKGDVKKTVLVVYGDIVFDKINITELWNDHIKGNTMATLLLTTSNKPSEKGTVKVEGNKILEFIQKPKKSDIYLVFSPIFVLEPEVLGYHGDSLEKDIFPAMALKGILNGHLSSEKERHVHSECDLK